MDKFTKWTLELIALILISFHGLIGEEVILPSGLPKQHDFDNDFEDGSIAPWMDLSEPGTMWLVDEISSDPPANGMEGTLQPPPPPTGKHLLWLKHDLNTFAVGTLSTQSFIAAPGDMVQFSYWISSKYSQFHNIEASLYLFNLI